MQFGTFDPMIYRELALELGQNMLRSIEHYSNDPQVRQMLFDQVNEKFPLDVNNIPIINMTAPAA
jgi:hypothetical protein